MKKSLFFWLAPLFATVALAQPSPAPEHSEPGLDFEPAPVPELSAAPLALAGVRQGGLPPPPPAVSEKEDPQSAQNSKNVVRVEPAGEREIATRLQIFLDQQGFGPGKIDGEPGEFTAKALLRYEKAHGLPPSGTLEEGIARLPLDSVYPIYTFYTITPEDERRIGAVPRKPEEQAKLKKMPYGSLSKFLEERFHCSPKLLQTINPGLNLDHLAAGVEVRVPNVSPFKIEEVRAIAKLPKVPEFQSRVIRIHTKERVLELYDGDALIAAFPITPGSSSLPAPAGTWRILGIATMPWFRHDEGVLNHGVRTENFYNIPAGPTNPVGVVWIGLSRRGIGIHGTNNPQTIGRAASHGCIRLANWDAIRLARMITEGMTVIIDEGIPRGTSVAAAKP